MRVIFLDIDGVLNCKGSFEAVHAIPALREEISNYIIDPALVLNLKRIVDCTGAAVVLSSSWRHNCPAEGHRLVAFAVLWSHGITVHSITPSLDFGPRGDEIAAWLQRHPETERYVILDDADDMREEQMPYLVRTSWVDGLQDSHVYRATELLLS